MEKIKFKSFVEKMDTNKSIVENFVCQEVMFGKRIELSSVDSIYNTALDLYNKKIGKNEDRKYFMYAFIDIVCLHYLTNLDLDGVEYEDLENNGLLDYLEEVRGYSRLLSYVETKIIKDCIKEGYASVVNAISSEGNLEKVGEQLLKEARSINALTGVMTSRMSMK